jgi:hypothetical protein
VLKQEWQLNLTLFSFLDTIGSSKLDADGDVSVEDIGDDSSGVAFRECGIDGMA